MIIIARVVVSSPISLRFEWANEQPTEGSCKIKALRAKTNTYIKTPVRGEEPIFVVTGRHEDVLEAKREIECAAEHFTQIRASRRHSQGGCPAPGHVTAYVRVPLRVVGLVVGPKGNTIKRIQQDTHTYIITPSREREPIFEVTGLPQNVEAARREIEQHIYQRTGNMPITDSSASIANYDLHVRQGSWSWSQSNGAAALQAQHAVLHANALNRPNYGALAVTSTARQLQHQHQAVPQLQPSPYQPQFHHQQYINKGPSLGDLNGGFCTQQQDIVQHGTGTKLFGSAAASPPPFGPIGGALPLGTSASSNNLHAMLGALDLDGGAQQGQHQGQPSSAADFKLDSSSMLLLRSSSNGLAAAQSRGGPSAFSPWRISSGTVDAVPQNDFLDLLTSTSPSPLFSASSGGGGGCHSSSYSGGSCGGIGGFACGELSSVNSTSRDEGLGDSPTNSFGRPNGADPYQHLMTIWADVCDGRAAGEVGKSAGETAEVKAKTEEKGGGAGGEFTPAGYCSQASITEFFLELNAGVRQMPNQHRRNGATFGRHSRGCPTAEGMVKYPLESTPKLAKTIRGGGILAPSSHAR
uniref:K Homology domain-containing protein n=1 Tax=Globodera rostochiensis TaxID=31243 RepID=A0A914HDE9_GLORO